MNDTANARVKECVAELGAGDCSFCFSLSSVILARVENEFNPQNETIGRNTNQGANG